MKLLDAILLPVVMGILVIAIHQTVMYGIVYSYWLYMVVAFGLFWLNIRKPTLPATPAQKVEKKKTKSPKQRK